MGRHPWTRRLVTAAGVLAVVAFGYFAGYSLVHVNDLSRQRQQDIQREREQSILRACRDTNERHDDAIRKLNMLVRRIPNERERARAEHNVAGTVTLIQAIVPKRDCVRLVRQSVSSGT